MTHRATHFILFGATSICWIMVFGYYLKTKKRPSNDDKEMKTANESSYSSYVSLIGNTPLIKLSKLSKILNRNVMVKMECMNPGGTGKDRAAKYMVEAAFESLRASKCAVEGTSVSRNLALQLLKFSLEVRNFIG